MDALRQKRKLAKRRQALIPLIATDYFTFFLEMFLRPTWVAEVCFGISRKAEFTLFFYKILWSAKSNAKLSALIRLQGLHLARILGVKAKKRLLIPTSNPVSILQNISL